MKKNEFIQIKGLDLKELKTKVSSLRDEIANLVLDKNMKKLKDKKSIFKKKKDLAQVLTIVRQKGLLLELENKKELKLTAVGKVGPKQSKTKK
ncbi:50S ribosomal protein L29 [Candidatus Daviesbacteria bacterium]|nr:50S ribosomal protein L29 [Candidatus Daviesbacteria bacterium]